ncbi:HAD family hydrolase [Halobellus limi]|uniref:HAD family hydrolase n=1 Tax=Halobellus limi TaxID=699433 RepID=A0A1H5V809_9EURY|nr:HAD family hydrolase [Halobellus limi]QCC46793.1 HAD family hydrolase [Halobellus limi]SEF83343.1 phosphoglycolate phosphatase [Halobellus limi]
MNADPIDAAYDFWLFDLDGTLVDAEWSYTREVFDRVGDRVGREFTDREAEVIWHGLGGGRDPQLREWGIDPETFWPAFHAVEDPQARAEATYLHDDAADLVSELVAADVPVGVVTHCQEFLAEPVVEHLDVGDWFDAFVSCTAETGWKPDPGPVHRAIERLGLHPSRPGRGVLAGDGASDVGAAWNAGLDGIHVERHSPEHRGRCVLADHRVSSFDELSLPDRGFDVAADGGTVEAEPGP